MWLALILLGCHKRAVEPSDALLSVGPPVMLEVQPRVFSAGPWADVERGWRVDVPSGSVATQLPGAKEARLLLVDPETDTQVSLWRLPTVPAEALGCSFEAEGSFRAAPGLGVTRMATCTAEEGPWTRWLWAERAGQVYAIRVRFEPGSATEAEPWVAAILRSATVNLD